MLAALKLLGPSLIAGAMELIKDKKARKENLTKPSTLTGASLIASAALSAISPETASQVSQSIGMPPDTLEGAVTQIAMGIAGIILIFLRRGNNA